MAKATISGLLIEELENAFDKRSWHGANLIGALRGVKPAEAVASIAKRKSIAQQLLHAAYWKHRVLTYLGDTTPFPRAASNWPKNPLRLTLQQWKADIDMIHQLQQRLIGLVGKMPAAKLNRKARWLIHGAAAHDLYHAGQIKLLRKMLYSSQ